MAGWRLLFLGGLLVLLAATLGACANAGSTAGTARTQQHEGGQVTVKVRWDGPASGPNFQVALDTHVVDLDGYDLSSLATLRLVDGTTLTPLEWTAPKGGHHREGLLRFPATLADGRATIRPGGGPIELVLRDIAGISERRFQWTP